jgi:hypothetical protein
MTMTNSTARPARAVLATATVAMLAACADGTAPNAAGQVGVGFQLATSSLSAAALSAAGGVTTNTGVTVNATDAGLRIARGSDVIVVTKAQLVVRDVKLKTAVATCTDDDDANRDIAADKRSGSSAGSRASDDDAECPTIQVGPFLVDMPVSGADAGRVSVAVPEGTYSRVRLTIHKVTSGDAADLAFQKANPDFRDISVRLVGTYNGKPFTFVNDLEAQLTVPLTAPLTIKAGGDNVTVTLDLAPWFANPTGGLYNPADANVSGTIRSRVQNAMRAAFRAFRDTNRDGRED